MAYVGKNGLRKFLQTLDGRQAKVEEGAEHKSHGKRPAKRKVGR